MIALLTIGSMFLGYIDSIGLAMAGICIDDQKDIGTAVGIAGSVRSAVSTVCTAVYTVSKHLWLPSKSYDFVTSLEC
jgi:hypothetical protein